VRTCTVQDVLKRLNVLVALRGTQKAVAVELGFPPAFVNDVIHGRREVSDNLARAVLKATYGCEFEKLQDRWRRVRNGGEQ
jgi:DNA-binding transcriptional regulator YdaS (Cro superfamily)